MKTLLVTNDFLPTLGGIQTYLADFVEFLDPEDLVVYCSTQDADAAAAFDASVPYTVVRSSDRVMLPTRKHARKMAELIEQYEIDVVWFGAAAPLALMGNAARKAGARLVVASTHGHEVGWSMIPGARQALGRIGEHVDLITYVSEYAWHRTHRAFEGRCIHPLEFAPLQPGVDCSRFRPDQSARLEIRRRHGISPDQLVFGCISRIVPRKGQDLLVEILPEVLHKHPDALLMIAGPGDENGKLKSRARQLGVEDHVLMPGAVSMADLPGYYNALDLFTMPVRTIAHGLNVEGLGIVFLEAQACGVPVVVGDGGGSPETLINRHTGQIVSGYDPSEVSTVITDLLSDEQRRKEYGKAARAHVLQTWDWSVRGPRLEFLLGSHSATE